MKKCYFALMAMLMALVLVGFAACGDDEPKVADIVGTWQYDNSDMLDDFALFFQFTKDGKFHQITSYIGVDGMSEYFALHGTYAVKGNKLTITYDSESYGERETISFEYLVQGDRLTLMGQEPATFIRVKDSVLYL